MTEMDVFSHIIINSKKKENQVPCYKVVYKILQYDLP